ncbi:MAG TPA: hypothetical protein V6D22_10630 [Candidatus Obscuribacterales bacterium]
MSLEDLHLRQVFIVRHEDAFVVLREPQAPSDGVADGRHRAYAKYDLRVPAYIFRINPWESSHP